MNQVWNLHKKTLFGMGMDIFWNNTMENVCFPVFLILKNLFLLMDFQLGIIFVTVVLLDSIYCKALLVSNIWLLKSIILHEIKQH